MYSVNRLAAAPVEEIFMYSENRLTVVNVAQEPAEERAEHAPEP